MLHVSGWPKLLLVSTPKFNPCWACTERNSSERAGRGCVAGILAGGGHCASCSMETGPAAIGTPCVLVSVCPTPVVGYPCQGKVDEDAGEGDLAGGVGGVVPSLGAASVRARSAAGVPAVTCSWPSDAVMTSLPMPPAGCCCCLGGGAGCTNPRGGRDCGP